jgi:hypothetical protein
MRGQAPAVKSAFETWVKRKGRVLESQKRLYEGLIKITLMIPKDDRKN